MPSLKIDIIVDDKGRPVIENVAQSMKGLATSTEHANSVIKQQTSVMDSLKSSWVKIAALAGGAYLGKQIIQLADSYTLMDNKLKLVTASAEQLKYVQEGLYKQSIRSYSSYEASVDLFQRLARSTESLGVSQSELLRITETVNKAFVISGATQEEARNAIIQLSQGLAAGALRGDEFRSVVEQASRVTKMLTDSLGVNVGGLREMAFEGKLTTDVLIKAFSESAKTIDDEFAKMQPTISQAMTNLSTVFGNLLSDSNKSAEGTKSVASEILRLADTIEQNKPGIIELFTEIISLAGKAAKAIGNIGQSLQGWGAVKRGDLGFGEFATMGPEGLKKWLSDNDTETKRIQNQIAKLYERREKAILPHYQAPIDREISALQLRLADTLNKEYLAGSSLPNVAKMPALDRTTKPASSALKAVKELNKEYEELIKTIDKGEQAMMRAWEGHGGGMGADGIWQSVDAWKEAAKELHAYEQLMANFDDNFATATLNAKNELDALLIAEKSVADESKKQFDELGRIIDGWGKDSADAIAQFCMNGEISFGNMINSMIHDLLKMMIYQNITGPLFSAISGGGIFGLFGSLIPGFSMGFGDWTGGLGFHGGGVPAYDSPAFTRTVPGAVFANAPRFHSGIGPGERAAIIRNDEGVFTPGQMKAMGKGSGGGTIVNINIENPVFQDLETQQKHMAKIAEVVCEKVAPGAVVKNYKNDGEIRAMVKGRA